MVEAICFELSILMYIYLFTNGNYVIMKQIYYILGGIFMRKDLLTAVAGLLHDIGKVVRRAGNKNSHSIAGKNI